MIEFILMFLAIGFSGGILAGMLGVGGGIIYVPVLLWYFTAQGYDTAMHIAIACSLAVIIPTASVNSYNHNRKGAVNWERGKRWFPYVAVGSGVGSILAGYLDGEALVLFFGAMLLVLGLGLVLGKPIGFRLLMRFSSRIYCTIVGGCATLMGIGAGSFLVPAMLSRDERIHRAVGTAAFLGLAIAIPGTLGFIYMGLGVEGRPEGSFGYLLPILFLILSIGSVAGTPVGGYITHSIPDKALRKVFGVFLLIAGSRLVWRGLEAYSLLP